MISHFVIVTPLLRNCGATALWCSKSEYCSRDSKRKDHTKETFSLKTYNLSTTCYSLCLSSVWNHPNWSNIGLFVLIWDQTMFVWHQLKKESLLETIPYYINIAWSHTRIKQAYTAPISGGFIQNVSMLDSVL